MARWILPGLILLSFLLRVVAIDKFPIGLNPDEASFGYDAYSLLKTGRDQWGNSWPLSLHSFGDYKLPLYSYLAIPFVALIGLGEFATRLPNALFGALAVVATYLLVIELFKNKKLALASAFLLAISPWHILLSRGAFEANLTTFFIPFGIWSFYKGLKDPKWLIVSAIVFGINLFSYHSARLVTPLIVFALWFYNRRQVSVNRNIAPLVIFVVYGLVAGWTLLSGGAARGSDVAIFNPTDHGEATFQRRFEGTVLGLPDQVSRLFSNKYTFVFDQFIKNYSTYFSPQFLFTEGPIERTYGMMPGFGVLYIVESIFILFAFITLVKKKDWGVFKLLILWLVLAPIPAALAKGGGFAANRSAIMMPAIQIISAYGLLAILENYKKVKVLVFIVLAISFIFFAESYLFHSPIQSAPSMHYGKREMVDITSKIEGNYSEIIVSRSLSEPHIFFAFFRAWNPEEYQKETQDWLRYKKEGRSFIDQLGEYHLGKYTFTNIDFEINSQKENVLLIGKPDEFPRDIRPLNIVNLPNGKPVIYIVDPKKVNYASN